MAQGRKSKGYQDPLDSIFGAIFGSAKSKPVKVKPTKLTGYNSASTLARGIAEIASKPATYVSDAAFGPINELANQVNITQFEYDQFDGDLRRGKDPNAGRFRLRGGEVGKFLTNPNAFVDSVFEKAKEERKWANVLNLGRGMDSAILLAWAKKQGFSTAEAAAIGLASSNWLSADQKNQVRRKFAENVVLKDVAARTNLTSGQAGHLPKDIAQRVQTELASIKGVDIIKSKGDVASILNRVSGLSSRPDFNQIVDDIYASYEKDSLKPNSPHGANWQTEGTINRDGYISTLRNNYSLRAALLDTKDPKQRQEYTRLMKAQNALDTIERIKGPGFGGKSYGDMRDYYVGVLKEIDDTVRSTTDPAKRIQIQQLQSKLSREFEKNFGENKFKRTALDILVPWGNTISGDYSKFKKALIAEAEYNIQKQRWEVDAATRPEDKIKAQIELELLESKRKGLQTMSGTEWRIYLADIEGTFKTMDGVFLKGGLGAALFNGTAYFKDGIGSTAPGDMTFMQLRKYANYTPRFLEQAFKKLDPNDPMYKAKKAELEASLRSVQGWAGKYVMPRQDIGEGYASMAYLYYLTPSSMFKTFFFNAEGLIALNQLRRAGYANQLMRTGKAQQLYNQLVPLFTDKKYEEAIKKFFQVNAQGQVEAMNKMFLSTNYLDFYEAMSKGKGQLGALWDDVDKFYRMDQNGGLARLIDIFGAPQRVMGRFQQYYNIKFKNDVNRFLADKVFRKILGNKVADNLIAAGLSNLGIRQVISMAVSEAMASIGAAVGGPIGAVAAAVLTFVMEGLIERLIKPFIKLFFAFMWAFIVVLLALIAWILMLLFGSNPLPQQHIPPVDALECAAGNPFADLYKFDPIEDDLGNLPGPIDGTCPINSSSMYCTQGDGAGVSNYHAQYHGVDIGKTGLSDLVWYAPSDGNVVSFSAVNYCSDGKDYGGALIFNSGGVTYRLLHVKALASGHVSKGSPVAIMQLDITPGYCWTGAHFHLDVQSGGWVDAEKWYKEKLKCNISSTGTGCG